MSIAAAAAEAGGIESLRAYAIAKMVNSPGGPSDDFEAWRDVSGDPAAEAHSSGGAGTLFRLLFARTRMAETPGVAPTAVLVLSPILPSDEVALATAGLAYPLLTVVKTSLDVPPPPSEAALVSALVSAVLAEYDAAVALAAEGLLHATHVQARMGGEMVRYRPSPAHTLPLLPSLLLPPPLLQAWDHLWQSGVELEAAAVNGGAGRGRPAPLAPLANSSLYSLLSFLRTDWPFGSSPGGLSTNGGQWRGEQ